MNCYQIKPVYTFVIALWLLLGAACMKDMGNYSYISINRILIKGMDTAYTVNNGERLFIKPLLEFTGDNKEDTANYSYKWVIDHQIGFYGTNNGILLSTQRDLDTIITSRLLARLKLGFGAFSMYYRVTDKRTGVFTDQYFNLVIRTETYDGWLLLCDTEDGNSRLDMVAPVKDKDTVYIDVLKKMHSAYTPNGNPGYIATGFSFILRGAPTSGTVSLFMSAGKQAVVLGKDSLEYKPRYNMQNVMGVMKPITDWSGSRFYIGSSSGILYVASNLYYMGDESVDGPINTRDGGTKLFPASRWVATQKGAGDGDSRIVYDEESGTFLRYPGSGFTCITLPDGKLFNYTTGMDLLYMGYAPVNGGEAFAVLKDKGSGKKYLARFSLRGEQHYFAEITGDDIAGAEQFAVSPESGYLFYNAEGKVYEYDADLKRSLLMHDYGARTISLMQFLPFAMANRKTLNAAYYTSLSRKLLVCTYTKGAPVNSGTMDIYTVPDINRPIQLFKSFSGMGKIVSIAYNER